MASQDSSIVAKEVCLKEQSEAQLRCITQTGKSRCVHVERNCFNTTNSQGRQSKQHTSSSTS